MSDDSATWHDLGPLEAFRDHDVAAATVAGRELAIYRIGGEAFATDLQCTHGQARLCEGFFLDGEIECPLHQGRFDVRSGKALCEPLTEDLRCHPLELRDGRVWVRV
jgi:naphthalene 1,2-dioxygenase system ferredoxin subunit